MAKHSLLRVTSFTQETECFVLNAALPCTCVRLFHANSKEN